MNKSMTTFLILILVLIMIPMTASADECEMGGQHELTGEWKPYDCEAGFEYDVCTKCNLQIFRVTEPRAHNWVSRRGPLNDRGELINVNTCVEPYYQLMQCSICHINEIRGPLSPMGHEVFEWTSTPGRPGNETGTCQRCGSIVIRKIPTTLTVSNPRVSEDGRLHFTATNNSNIIYGVKIDACCGTDIEAPWGTVKLEPGASADGYIKLNFTEEELANRTYSRDLYLVGYATSFDEIPSALSEVVHIEGSLDIETLKENGYFSELNIRAYGVYPFAGPWKEGDAALIGIEITNLSVTDEVIDSKYVLTRDGRTVAEGSSNALAPGTSCISFCSDVFTAHDIEKRYFDREIKVAYKLNDGSEKTYLAHGRVFMDNIFFNSERVTLTGSTEVNVGFAMDGNTPYDWCYTITNETGEKLISFDTVITREGQKEYAYRRTEELAPGAFIDVGYSIMPALTPEEKADVRTDSDTASIYYTMQVTACSESGKIYDSNVITFTYKVHSQPYDYSIYAWSLK